MDALFVNHQYSVSGALKLSPNLTASSFPSQPHLIIIRPKPNPSSISVIHNQPNQFLQTQKPLSDDESYGEVDKIIGSRATPTGMQYLIQWKDGHAPSWVSSDSIAKDVVAEYDSPWWTAAKNADDAALRELLDAEDDRDVDAVDSDGRTALLFVAGLGSEACVRLLAEAGADLDHKDNNGGLAALHMAAGYVRPGVVKLLVELGADPELEDERGRKPLDLAKEILRTTPKGNPVQFARRLGLESVIRELEGAVFEYAGVHELLEKRGKGDAVEYLVKWKDGGDNEWVNAHGNRLASALNNISFANPAIDVLQAYYRNISGYYEANFPDKPPTLFNFTAEDLMTDNITLSDQGTRVKMLNYNETVEIIFQGTNVMNSGENHPVHLHGFKFFVVGAGVGNFDNETDPLTYNLIDPPELNTFPVPKDGWTVIRFVADNPGVWFMHCHFDRHMSWGMDTAFIVRNGDTEETSVRPPPEYMPSCGENSIYSGDEQSMFKLEE